MFLLNTRETYKRKEKKTSLKLYVALEDVLIKTAKTMYNCLKVLNNDVK